MPSLSLPHQLIWFAHCPKAGGTSVEQFMVSRWGDAVGHLHWGWDLWWKRGGWRVADPPNSPQHLIWDDAVASLPRVPDRVFTIVRDPVARLQSEYRWQRRLRRGTKLGKLLAYLPFWLWLRVMLALMARHPHAFDNHLRPQSDFVPGGARFFHLEDGLGPAIRWLAETTGTTVPDDATLPHVIPTGAGLGVAPDEASRIAVAHAEDYRRFGYAPPPRCHRRDAVDWMAERIAPLLAYLDRHGAL